MIWIVVEADVIGFVTSEQRTTVPFKPMLTESIDTVEIRGLVSTAEILMKVNVAEFTLLYDIQLSSEAIINTELAISTSVPCSLACQMLHLINFADAVHVI